MIGDRVLTHRNAGALQWAVAACALLAVANLLAGLSGGLARLGLPLPAAALASHGAVMVCAFFGALISLERALALKHPLGLVAPLAACAGGLLAWALQDEAAATAAWLVAAISLVALYVLAGATRAWSLHLGVELAGALCWGAGTFAWAADEHSAARLGWMAFLVLTIAGERRELMQMVRLSLLPRLLFVATVACGLIAVALSNLAFTSIGSSGLPPDALWWLTCAGLALWLLRWDLAPRMWRQPGWIGHTAVCLTVGYCWLLAGALLGLVGLWRPAGVAVVAPHAVLLGFVFAMVFGHAPIILPALFGLRPRYSSWVRLPVWLLSASLALRLAGAETRSIQLLAWGGLAHALAIALFGLLMLRATLGVAAR